MRRRREVHEHQRTAALVPILPETKKASKEALPTSAAGRAGLAGRQGLEPRFIGPEPIVLPLNDLPAESKPAAGCRVKAGDATCRLTPRSRREFHRRPLRYVAQSSRVIDTMLPEVFDVPQRHG